MAYIIDNNVLTTLHTSITGATTSLVVDVPAAPNKVPVSPAGGNIATLTIVDSVVSPTQIEIITYTTATNNGDGTYTLTGVTRAQEGTAAQSFAANAVVFQAVTAATLNALGAIGINTLTQFCGYGSDGDATISTAVTLTTDTYYRNLTITSAGSINTGGYALYVSGNLDLTAAVAAAIFAPFAQSGQTAVGSAGGAGGAGSIGITVPSGASGGSGGSSAPAVAGVAGTGFLAGPHCFGGSGGHGPIVGSAALGAGGQPVTVLDIKRPGSPLIYTNGTTMSPLGGGCGGGGGGGGTPGGGAGGGGGGGACALVLYAATISTSVSTPAGVIQGGIGGQGGNAGNYGAGGGGGGGPVYIGFGNRVGPVVVNGIRARGGSTGAQNGGGIFARGGDSGPIQVFNLLSGVGTLYTSVTGALGTSGISGAGGLNNANL